MRDERQRNTRRERIFTIRRRGKTTNNDIQKTDDKKKETKNKITTQKTDIDNNAKNINKSGKRNKLKKQTQRNDVNVKKKGDNDNDKDSKNNNMNDNVKN